jgi:hypothetical protein
MRRFYTLRTALTKAFNEFDESKHPRDHGKFSSGGASSGAAFGGVTDAHRQRATESLKDKTFLGQHRDRLIAASNEAEAKFPDDLSEQGRYGAAAQQAGAGARHEEAARIHAESDLHGGDDALRSSMDYARAYSRAGDESTAAQHEAAIAAHGKEMERRSQDAADHANEERAVAAGHVTTEARDVATEYSVTHERLKQEAEAHAGKLEQAHTEALIAVAALHAHEHEGDEDAGVPERGYEHTHDLADAFQGAHDSLYSDGLTERDLPEIEHGDLGHIEPALHPDSGEYAANHSIDHPHPDSEDYSFENLHPDHADYEPEHPHPDSLSGEDKPQNEHERQQMLSAHNAEREASVAAHEVERAQALAEHNAERSVALAAHEQFKSKLAERDASAAKHAEAAQTALERLHAQQVESHADLQRIHGESKKAHEAATEHLESMDEDHHVNEAALEHADDATYGAAERASETMRDRAMGSIETSGHLDLGESLNSLRSSMKTTASAIKELSKHTGRAPNLPAKAPKKTKKRFYSFAKSDDEDSLSVDEHADIMDLATRYGVTADGLGGADDDAVLADLEKFDPSQARGPDGKWSSGGGGRASPRSIASASRAIDRAKERVATVAGRVATAKEARRGAVAAARSALKAARVADKKAQKDPTGENKRAAKTAATAARRAAAKVDRHHAALERHQDAHRDAKDTLIDARAARADLRRGDGPRAPAAAADHTADVPAPIARAPAASTHEEMANHVHDAASRVPASRLEDAFPGHSAFVHDTYNHLTSEQRQSFGTLDNFKQKLVDLNQRQLVSLQRQDLVDMHSDKDIEHAEIHDMGEQFHRIIIPAGHKPAAAAATPTAPSGKPRRTRKRHRSRRRFYTPKAAVAASY